MNETPEQEVPLRIFHGPINTAGSPRIHADTQRNLGMSADAVVFADHSVRQSSHYNLRTNELGYCGRIVVWLAFFVICLIKYDVFHFSSSNSLLPFNLDLPLLRLFRKKIIMQYNGSDIRLASVEAKRNPYFIHIKSQANDPRRDARKIRRMRWHRLWVHRAIAIRNLYLSASQVYPSHQLLAHPWASNPIDLSQYPVMPLPSKPQPLIVHAPSKLDIKGTQYVESTITALQEAGYRFEYRRLHRISHEEVQRVLREEADIVIDQLLMGGIGTLAMEGMAARKTVVAYILPDVFAEHLSDCPVVNVTVETLQERLAWLLDNPEERAKLGIAGRRFVERHCDAGRINRELLKLYKML